MIVLVTFTALLASLSNAQEAPSIFLNDTYKSARQNFCPLHRQVESGEIARRDILRNQNLHVALFDYQLNSEGVIDELSHDVATRILDELALRAGFKWRDSFGIVDSPSGNETWDTALEGAIDGYDLLGEWYLRSTARLDDGILFPEGWYDGSLIMVRKKSDAVDQFVFFAFLRPFDGYVWLLILVTIFVSGFVYYLIDYVESRSKRKEMEGSLSKNIFAASYYMAGHFEHDPSTASTRIMAFSLCFLFLILTSAYTANLASFLVAKNTGAIVINDIKDAVKHDQSFCVLRGASSHTFLTKNYPTAKLVIRESIPEAYDAVSAEECDIVLTTVGTWEINRRSSKYNDNCHLEWIGRVVEYSTAGYSLRDSELMCTSLLRNVIDLNMIEMKSDGTFDEIWLKYRDGIPTVTCLGNEDKQSTAKESIKVKNLGGLFICHSVVMAFVVMFSLLRLHKTTDKENVRQTLKNVTNLRQSLHKRSSHLFMNGAEGAEKVQRRSSLLSVNSVETDMNDDSNSKMPRLVKMDSIQSIQSRKSNNRTDNEIDDNQLTLLEDILMELETLREKVEKMSEDNVECKECE